MRHRNPWRANVPRRSQATTVAVSCSLNALCSTSILRLDRITAKWDCVALHHPFGMGSPGERTPRKSALRHVDSKPGEFRSWLRINPQLRKSAALLPNRDGRGMTRPKMKAPRQRILELPADQVQGPRACQGRRPAADTQLHVDVVQMPFDRGHRQGQAVCHLLVVEALIEQVEQLDFAQRRHTGCRGSRIVGRSCRRRGRGGGRPNPFEERPFRRSRQAELL